MPSSASASRRLPREIKARHPDIPWAEMAAAGNIYRHEYEDVAQRRVWGTVDKRLPPLLAAVEQEPRRVTVIRGCARALRNNAGEAR
jgi:uncharacterized protein with HEPN domain